MRRLLTGYAISFNHRHRRHGQLFQNRYKSILCQEEAYPELTGGGLIRSSGGWAADKTMRRGTDRMKGDERILGAGDFVESVV